MRLAGQSGGKRHLSEEVGGRDHSKLIAGELAELLTLDRVVRHQIKQVSVRGDEPRGVELCREVNVVGVVRVAAVREPLRNVAGDDGYGIDAGDQRLDPIGSEVGKLVL